MLVHTGDKPYCCDNCSKSFPMKHNLTKHIFIDHIEEYRHTISFKTYGKSFTEEGSLKRHKRFQTRDKPHSCEICGMLLKRNALYRNILFIPVVNRIAVKYAEERQPCQT